MIEPVQKESEITWTCMVKMIFSIAFIFSTIYLRLEGKVAPHPRKGMLELGSEQHFTFQVTLTLEVGKVPPPTGYMNAIEQN